MTRYIIRFIPIFLVAFVFMGIILRAVSYDEAYFESVRELFAPTDDCPAPCYLGVRPGSISTLDAMTQIRGLEWIQNSVLGVNYRAYPPQILDWDDNPAQPSFIKSELYVRGVNGILDWLVVPTSVRLGEMWIAFGIPIHGTANIEYMDNWYPNTGFYTRSNTHCRSYLWETADVHIPRWQAPRNSTYSRATLRAEACS